MNVVEHIQMHDRLRTLVESGGAGGTSVANSNLATKKEVVALLGVYNVVHFGADPTGISDSRAAIQAALDAADAAGGGTVFVPTGTYIVTKAATAWDATRKTDFGQSTAADAYQCLEVDNVTDVDVVFAPDAWIKIADSQQTGNATTGTIVHLLVGLDTQRFSIRGPGKNVCGFVGNKAGQTGWTGGCAQQQHGCLIFLNTKTAGAGNGINNIHLSGFSSGDCWSNPINIYGGVGSSDPVNGHIHVHNVRGYDFGEGIQFAGFYDLQISDLSQEIGYDREIQFIATDVATMTLASPCVVTHTAHGLFTGNPMRWQTTGALYTGLATGTTYFIEKINNDTYYLHTSFANATAASPSGTRINTSGTQSGTHTVKELGIRVGGGDGLEFSGCDNMTVNGYVMRGQTNGADIDVFGCQNAVFSGLSFHETSLNMSIQDGNGGRQSDSVLVNGCLSKGVVSTGLLVNASGKVDLANVNIISALTPYQILNGTTLGASSKPVNLFNCSVTTPRGAVAINTQRKVSVVGGYTDATINDTWNITSTGEIRMNGVQIVTTGSRPMTVTATPTGGLLSGCSFSGSGYPWHVTGAATLANIKMVGLSVAAPATNEFTNVAAYDYLTISAALDQRSLTGVANAGELHTLLIPSKDQMVELRFTGAVLVVNNSAASGATIKFKLAANFSATADDRLLVRYDGTSWVEVARSVN